MWPVKYAVPGAEWPIVISPILLATTSSATSVVDTFSTPLTYKVRVLALRTTATCCHAFKIIAEFSLIIGFPN
jgi:hypothetical protein